MGHTVPPGAEPSAGPSGGGPPAGPTPSGLAEFADRAVTPVAYRAGGREVAVPVVRRGTEPRADLDPCPPVYPPLTRHGRRVLGGGGERLRRTRHTAAARRRRSR